MVYLTIWKELVWGGMLLSNKELEAAEELWVLEQRW